MCLELGGGVSPFSSGVKGVSHLQDEPVCEKRSAERTGGVLTTCVACVLHTPSCYSYFLLLCVRKFNLGFVSLQVR